MLSILLGFPLSVETLKAGPRFTESYADNPQTSLARWPRLKRFEEIYMVG
jgi:hypothetical protein